MATSMTNATINVSANTRQMEKDILKSLRSIEMSEISTKKSSQALGRITGQVSEFNKSLEASNARVIAFGASAGVIYGVEKALTSLVSSTIEVEKKLADINVLLNLSGSSLEKFGSSLFDVARNTAQSFSTVADAATELSRQGLGVEETLKRTNAALILTRLSGLDAKSSVEALTATLNSFSGSVLDATGVVNKLANVDAAFAVSSADLANAISRVGSTAQDAGVSLDELISIVTAAQQTTARGGAVIGNSLKTIFTRLQRGKVQDLLGSLGVDTSEGQSAISLLQQLATTYDKLGASQKSYIAEQVGGVFQINILKAALSDLGKEYSIYERALATSLSSTDQAIRRNEELNKTVSALSSQALANLEQAASKIGSIVFEPNAKGFLGEFNKILESFNNIDTESAGGKFISGFFKGIGNFIAGPGAVLATAVLVKLLGRFSKFAAGSVSELLGRNEATKQQAALEQSVLSILQKNSVFTEKILSGKMTTVQAEKQLLDYLTAQSNVMREQERISKVIAANLGRAGVSVGASGVPLTRATGKKTSSSGFVPNFASEMAVGQAMENAGAKQHGYTAGKVRKTRIHDGNGKSFSSFVNSKEDIKTFTNAAGKKATIVRPPNGFGENTQYAAGGFVPNFAKEVKLIKKDFKRGYIVTDGDSTENIGEISPKTKKNKEGRLKYIDAVETGQRYADNAEKIAKDILYNQFKSAELLQLSGGSSDKKAAFSRYYYESDKLAKELVTRGYGVPDLRYTKSYYKETLEAMNSGSGIWNSQNKRRRVRNGKEESYFVHAKAQQFIQQANLDKKIPLDEPKRNFILGRPVNYKFGGIGKYASRELLPDIYPTSGNESRLSQPMFSSGFVPNFAGKSLTASAGMGSYINADLFSSKKGGRLEIESMGRGKFPTKTDPNSGKRSVSNILYTNLIESAKKEIAKKKKIKDWASVPIEIVGELLPQNGKVAFPQGLSRLKIAKSAIGDLSMEDASGRLSSRKLKKDQLLSLLTDPSQQSSLRDALLNLTTLHSGGFVPNFGDALSAAIGRERSAGLSNSQIYVDRHSSLKNKNNPMGLMVANTRDEPMGGVQGIKRAKKEGRNPKTYGSAYGFIPNFASRSVGYLDGDVLSDPKYASIVEEQIKILGIKAGIPGYHKYLGDLAKKYRKIGSIKKFTGIFGVPGAGKSSMMLGGKNAEKADNAKLRQTRRMPILTPKDLEKVDEVIDTRASLVGTAAAIEGGYWSELDRLMIISSSTPAEQEEIKRRRNLRDEEIKKGKSKTAFGREAGTSQGAGLDSAYIEAVALDVLGPSKTRVMGINSKFELRRKKEEELPLVERRKVGLAYGAFSPATRGHLEMMQEAKKLGIPPEDFIVAVSREGGKIDEKDPHSFRTLIFDQKTRKYLAEKTFTGANVVGAGADFSSGVRRVMEIGSSEGRRRFLSAQKGSTAFVGSDKTEKDFAKYTDAGYDVSVGQRIEGISGTDARAAILAGDNETMAKIFAPHVLSTVQEMSPKIKNRANVIPEILKRVNAKVDQQLNPIQGQLSKLPARITKNTPIEIQEQVRSLRETRDGLQKLKQKLPEIMLKKLAGIFPEKYGIPALSQGLVPNFGDQIRKNIYDWDGTIIPTIKGGASDYITGLKKLNEKNLTPLGKKLKSGKKKFDIVTARPSLFESPIWETAKRLGLPVNDIMFGVNPKKKLEVAAGRGSKIVDDNLDLRKSKNFLNANVLNNKIKSMGRSSFGGFIPNFASPKQSGSYAQRVLQELSDIKDFKAFEQKYQSTMAKTADMKRLYQQRKAEFEGGAPLASAAVGAAAAKTEKQAGKVKELGKGLPFTMIHPENRGLEDSGLQAWSRTIKNAEGETRETFTGGFKTAGLQSSSVNKFVKARGLTDRVSGFLLGEANDLAGQLNPASGKVFSDLNQFSDKSTIMASVGTVFESAVRKAFNQSAESKTQGFDFPSPNASLREFFGNAPGPYEAKGSNSGPNKVDTLRKWVNYNNLSAGFVPNFAYKISKTLDGAYAGERTLTNLKSGSYTRYAKSKRNEEFLDIKYIRSLEKGNGLEMFNRLGKIAKRSGKKLYSDILIPQKTKLDSLGAESTFEQILKALYPQLLYRQRSNVKNTELRFSYFGDVGSVNEKLSGPDVFSLVLGKIKNLHASPGGGPEAFIKDARSSSMYIADVKDTFAKGFIPNFADPLKKAIKREQSAGLSNSQIYVDSHSSLKNKNNPMGLMVANTRDEPMGGIQGIRRAKKEGRNPKTYGAAKGFIPNFATNSVDEIQKAAGAITEVAEAISSALGPAFQGAADAGGGKSGELPNNDTDVGGNIVEAFESISSALGPAFQGAADAGGEPTKPLGSDPVKSIKGPLSNDKDLNAAAAAAEKAVTSATKEKTKVIDSAIEAGKKSVKATQNDTKATEASAKSKSGGGKLGALGGKIGSLAKKGFGKLKEVDPIALGFGAQTIAGIASQYAGEDTKEGRVTGAVAQGFGDVASFASAGAIFGGWGALAGGVVGATKAVIDIKKAMDSKAPELEKALKNGADSMARFGESGQKLLTLNEQYADAMRSGDPTKAVDIMAKTQQAYTEELSKLTSAQRSAMISAIAQGKGQEEYAKILSEMQDSVKAQETALQLTKFSESGGIFSGPDKKLIAGAEKSLALDFTKGMDISSISAALEKSADSLSDPSRGTENQALDLMRNLASSGSITEGQRENLNKMIEAFASAAATTDLSGVAEGFIKSIKDAPKSAEDVKRLTEANKAQIEAAAAKTRKEIQIREKTNAMLIKLQSETAAIYQKYNNSMEDFISSIQTASQMMSAAGEFRAEYLAESGANQNIVDPIKEKNIISKSNADLKVAIYKSQLDAGNNFNKGVDSLLSGIEVDIGKLGVGQDSMQQQNDLRTIKSELQAALLPVQGMLTSGNYEEARTKTEEVFKNLTEEQRSAIGEDKIASGIEQLRSGIDGAERAQDVLVKNSQRDLAIQAQQLIFQKAAAKLSKAQNFGGSVGGLLRNEEGSPFNKAILSLNSIKSYGYNQRNVQQGRVRGVPGGDAETFGLNGQKPGAGVAASLVDFYKAASEIGGESVVSTESKDFGVLTQVVSEQLRKKLDELKTAGEGVVDPSVFSRLEANLAVLGGEDQVAQLKLMKELGYANISGKKITDEALKGYTGGAFTGLPPELKKGFEATSDEGAAATFLLLADQQKQTAAILSGQTQQTDSLNAGLEQVVAAGLDQNKILAEQPSVIATAIGAILEKGRAEQKVDQVNEEVRGLVAKNDEIFATKQSNEEIIKSAKNEEWLLQERASFALSQSGYSQLDLSNEDKKKRAQTIVDIGKQAAQGGSSAQVYASLMKANGLNPFGLGSEIVRSSPEEFNQMFNEAKNFLEAIDLGEQANQQRIIAKDKETENESLSKQQAQLTAKEMEARRRALKLTSEELAPARATAETAQSLILDARTSGGQAFIDRGVQAREEAARRRALAENLAMQNGGDLLTEQQKKNRARSQGGGLGTPSELTRDVTTGKFNTFEIAAMNQFGEGSQKAFDALMQQQVLPSFENFAPIYERMGGQGKGREFYQQKRAELLGAEVQATTPAAAINKGVAVASVAKPATGGVSGVDVTSQERLALKQQYGFEQGVGFKNEADELEYQKAYEELKKKKKKEAASSVAPAVTPAAAAGPATSAAGVQPTAAQPTAAQPTVQQNTSQTISSILTSVQQIASEMQKTKEGGAAQGSEINQTPGVASSTGSISVSTPVNINVGSTDQKTADVSKAISEAISSFLSSQEFIAKVTSIANAAAGVKTPPFQIPNESRKRV